MRVMIGSIKQDHE